MIGDWCEREARQLALDAAISKRVAARPRLARALADRDRKIVLRGRSPELVAKIIAKEVSPKLDRAGRQLRAVRPRRLYAARRKVLAAAAAKFACSQRTANECWKLTRRLNEIARQLTAEINEIV